MTTRNYIPADGCSAPYAVAHALYIAWGHLIDVCQIILPLSMLKATKVDASADHNKVVTMTMSYTTFAQ